MIVDLVKIAFNPQYGLFLQTEKEKELLKKLRLTNKDLVRCKVETLLKIKLHLGTYWKNLLTEL